MNMNATTALLQALQDIQDRNEVEECMREMLVDVETAVTLREQFTTAQTMQTVRFQLLETQTAVAESRAMQAHGAQQQLIMADALVSELLSLSHEMGQLQAIRAQHEELLVRYDEVVAKLCQAEENALQEKALAKDQQQHPQQQPQDRDKSAEVADDTLPPTELVEEPIDAAPNVVLEPLSDETDAPVLIPPPAIVSTTSLVTEPVFDTETIPVPHREEAVGDAATLPRGNSAGEMTPPLHDSVHANVVADVTESAGAAADDLVVMLDDADPASPGTMDATTLRFDSLEAPILSHMFTYLDALDILNVAQVNMVVYHRVDSLFGLGDADLLLEDTSTIATNETPTDAVTMAPMNPSSTSGSSMNVPDPPPPPNDPQPTVVALPTSVASTPTAVLHPQPTLVALPPMAAKPVAAPMTPTVATMPPTTNATTTAPNIHGETTAVQSPTHKASNSADASMSRLFSMLQPRRPGASASASPIHTPPRQPRAPENATLESAMPLNAAMANSMAAKLSDTELHAVFLMTERLKQKESLTARLIKEKEDLAAKLDGTEGVKQFLIAKVRDMEVSLSGFVEHEMKVALQIASDQEVIAFLDGRVQELERDAHSWHTQTRAAQDALHSIEQQSTQKATVLGDMLQFEREKLTDQEREWKATKKVLVKEVKHCRAQIVALQAERDGYREQNETLRRALGMTGTSSNGSAKREY